MTRPSFFTVQTFFNDDIISISLPSQIHKHTKNLPTPQALSQYTIVAMVIEHGGSLHIFALLSVVWIQSVVLPLGAPLKTGSLQYYLCLGPGGGLVFPAFPTNLILSSLISANLMPYPNCSST